MKQRDMSLTVGVACILFAAGPVLFWWPFLTNLKGAWGWAFGIPWVVGFSLPVVLGEAWGRMRTAITAGLACVVGGLVGQLGVFMFMSLRGGNPSDLLAWSAIPAVQYWSIVWAVMGLFPVAISTSVLVIRDQSRKSRDQDGAIG